MTTSTAPVTQPQPSLPRPAPLDDIRRLQAQLSSAVTRARVHAAPLQVVTASVTERPTPPEIPPAERPTETVAIVHPPPQPATPEVPVPETPWLQKPWVWVVGGVVVFLGWIYFRRPE